MTTRMMKKITTLLLAILLLAAAAPVCSAEGGNQKLDTYYALAVGYINRGNYDKAMEYLDAALNLTDSKANPEMYADLHLKKGCVFTIRKEYTEALKELDETIRVAPETPEAWLVKVQVYTESDKPAEAAANLEKYIELTGDTSLNETLARLYLQAEDRKKAEESYRKLAESVTEDPELIPYNLAAYEMGAGMYAEALENLKQCRAETEKMPGLHYNTGVCQMMLNNYPDAIVEFSASLETEDFRSDALYNRAVCSMSLAEYRAAIEDFTGYIDGLAGKENGGETEAAAEETTEDMNTGRAENDAVYYYRGACYLSVNEFDAAAADFSVCIENGINETESVFNRGVSYLQAGKYEEAKADLTASIDQGYMADDAMFYRSYAFRGLEDNEAALADLSACVEHGYNLAQSYQQRAQVYKALGDEDNYLKDLEASLDYLED